MIAIVIWNIDFDPVIFSISDKIRRAVGDGVLIPEFVANILERLIEIVDVIGEEGAASSFLRQIFQNFIALRQMHLAVCGP